MTGFGVGRAPLSNGHVVVEVRALNHRYLDVRVRASQDVTDLSDHVELLAQRQLSKDRYEIALRLDGEVSGCSCVDLVRAQAVYESLCALRDRIAPTADVPFSMLAGIADLFVPHDRSDRDATLDAVSLALDRAIVSANAMREVEGKALWADLLERLEVVRKHTRYIEDRRASILDGMSKRFRDRVQRLMKDTGIEVDPVRLAQEVALAADRCDIAEELTRLDSHCSQFQVVGADTEPSGRRLDFLLQEMAREINTVGAKSQDASVAHVVVDIKAEIERMREQVQNVE